MSRSHLLAGLFLILGAVDLVLLNVWLVPAAWPPSSGPIAMPTTLAEVEPTPEVEETSVERSMVPAEAAAPQQGPAVVPEFADTAVEHEGTIQSTAGQAEDDPVAETTAAVEPPRLVAVAPDSADTAVEHEGTIQSTAGQAEDDPVA
ncbi:MAG: hypothetical protein QNL12_12065, partial [Acidimicrobiia bacterium]|nr:hypothetical protein [Acidimicrobiia bacterium]MDX2468043.1 hypothetical protein [Acidimicrobiia bacterium]